MKKLLLIIPLLTGCTREYICDAGPPCEVDTLEGTDEPSNVVLGTVCDAIITVDWPDGEKDAEEECDEMYNSDSDHHRSEGSQSIYQSCTCKKATRMQY